MSFYPSYPPDSNITYSAKYIVCRLLKITIIEHIDINEIDFDLKYKVLYIHHHD